jgi:hypothetical protein
MQVEISIVQYGLPRRRISEDPTVKNVERRISSISAALISISMKKMTTQTNRTGPQIVV